MNFSFVVSSSTPFAFMVNMYVLYNGEIMSKSKQRIGIVGFGHVGKALTIFFSENFNVSVYDPNVEIPREKFPNIQQVNKDAINTCDLAVVCVPTPAAGDTSVDLSIIEETISWLETPLILIKSTVPPGTTNRFVQSTGKKIAFSPEYLGESTYVTQWWKDIGYIHPFDLKKHDFQIFGGSRDTTSAILEFFKVVMGPVVKYIQTDAKTAELTKYMENSWGATKVVFCNEFAKVAETFGVDYEELRELWLLDGRINRMHTAVFKDKRGFSGKCLPKDINGIVEASKKAGYEPKLLQEVIESNKRLSR